MFLAALAGGPSLVDWKHSWCNCGLVSPDCWSCVWIANCSGAATNYSESIRAYLHSCRYGDRSKASCVPPQIPPKKFKSIVSGEMRQVETDFDSSCSDWSFHDIKGLACHLCFMIHLKPMQRNTTYF